MTNCPGEYGAEYINKFLIKIKSKEFTLNQKWRHKECDGLVLNCEALFPVHTDCWIK
jgi:hypothetical protein